MRLIEPLPSKPSRVGEMDAFILKLCSKWRVARAKQHIAWAENSLATMWGTLPDQDIHLSFDGMDEMRKAEAHLCELEPRSVRTAREMLKVAIEICAYEGIDPEHTMAQGPVLGIVRNVTKALDNLDGDTPLGGPRAAT